MRKMNTHLEVFMRQESIVALTLVLCLCGCSEQDSVSDLVETQHALKTCTIVLGGGGKSQTISPAFDSSSGSYTVNTSKAWDFIRSTSGDCTLVPAMDRISYFGGGNCDAKAWNGFSYGANDSDNRYVGLRTNALNSTQASSRAVFDPGFRERSLTVRDWGTSNCTSATNLNRDYGRCLPSIMLNSFYTANASHT